MTNEEKSTTDTNGGGDGMNGGGNGGNDNKEPVSDDTTRSPDHANKSHDKSSSSTNTTVSVLNSYDFVVSCKLNDDLNAVKSVYNGIIKDIGLIDGDEPGRFTNEQITKCVNKVLKPDLQVHLSSILSSVQSVCIPDFTVGNPPDSKNNDIEPLATYVNSKIEELNSANQISLDKIQHELTALSASINGYKLSAPYNTPSNFTSTPIRSENKQQNIVHDHSEVHIEDVQENFLNDEECNELIDILSNYNFEQKNGHSVYTFGEPYRYTGSSKNQTFNDFPAKIKVILDRLSELHCEDGSAPLTSCLVNKFEGSDSFLKQHADDERSMDPNSKIYTISLGSKRTIDFTENNVGKKFTHVANPGSLYTMTRKSQHYFKHEIKSEQEETGLRYSLTFRSINWRNHKSTLLIGDSNTAKLHFGSGLGKFGGSLPGSKAWAPTLDDINPSDCIGYSNVVLLCGINDIKSRYVTTKDDVKIIYDKLACKVKEMQTICKGIKIVVCPILPTKLNDLNRKAIHFNSFIFNDLVVNNYGVEYIWGVNSFLDNNGLLKGELAKDNDYLHLNNIGARKLGKMIKQHFFPNNRFSNNIHYNAWKPSGAQNEGRDLAR